MIARGISVSEVEDALKRGSKELQNPDKILYHFRYFTVVSKKISGDDLIITVMPRW